MRTPLVFAMLVVTAAPTRADGRWSARAWGGLFVMAPEFSDEDKRIRQPRDGADFPEARFQGGTVAVGVELGLHRRVGLMAEAGLVVGSQSQAVVERLGVVVHPGVGLRIAAGAGLLELVLGSNAEGVGTSLHLSPLIYAGVDAEIARTDLGRTISIGVLVEGIRVCSNNDGCGVVAERYGGAWNMIAATILVAVEL